MKKSGGSLNRLCIALLAQLLVAFASGCARPEPDAAYTLPPDGTCETFETCGAEKGENMINSIEVSVET